MRVLVIEDDRQVADFVVKGLKENGFAVDSAHDGREGIFLAASEPYDVIVLDRMLPQVDGLSLLKTLRATGVEVPVLILSAMGEVNQRIEGLRAGGDDYMAKPFSITELVTRVQVLLKRKVSHGSETLLQVGSLSVDLLTRRASRLGKEIDLKPREFQLLEFLMRHAGQIVTRTMILEHVWDYNFDPQTNVIDVHISRLRNKIDKGFSPSLLHTVRGAGYSIRED
ncbi:response regulator transcription factor [Pelagibius sp. Alg239-R121]|uniref:response regulator transcription factor n=1 Tax=Pelagibius sp. Alg239-R121 TaxID=2993448 RepID=UPI0024A712C8|nr:response regulator transcription factor [Pelagibius sp. Alg239-R121]